MAREINVTRASLGTIISLGHVGENEATTINFYPTVFDGLGDNGFTDADVLQFELYMEQNGSSWQISADDLSIDTDPGGNITFLQWVVKSTELQTAGRGRLQIKFTSSVTAIEYSQLIDCVVERSIDVITSANPQLAPVYVADILEGLRAALNAIPKPDNAVNGHIAIFNGSREVVDSGKSVNDFASKNTPILAAEDKRSSASANIVLQLEDASVSQLTDGMLISFFTKYATAANSVITLKDHNGNNLCTDVPAYLKGTSRITVNYLVAKQFAIFRYFAVNPNDSQTSAFYLLTDYFSNTTYPYIANGTGKGSGNPSSSYTSKPTSVILGSTAAQVESAWANIASGKCSIAEGGRRPNKIENGVTTTYPVLTASGDYSHAEGASTQASGAYSHAQNKQSKACGESSTAMGASCVAGDENDSSKGTNALAAGELSVASGRTSIAMGGLCEATGNYAVAIGSGITGQKNVASGLNSFALGFNNTASGEKSYAQGNSSEASGPFAFALGNTCKAGNKESFALGAGASANATSGKKGGVAIGKNVQVTSAYGVSIGAGLIPLEGTDDSVGRVIIGRYNEAPDKKDIISFGIGSTTTRKTGLVIRADGDILGSGTVPTDDKSLTPKKYVDGRVVANPSGAPTAALTSIQIGGTIYSVGQQTCLIKGTNILMADGSEKPIELVRSGEMIKSYDPTTKEQVDAVVISAYKTGASRDFYVYNFSDGKHLTVYGDHRYFNPNAEELRPFSKVKPDVINGCSAFLNSEMSKVFCSQAIARNYQGELREHYNIIASNNLYFANGILCGHNPCDKYNYFVNRDIHTDLPPDVRTLLNHSCNEYNNYDGLCENPEYLKATRQSRNSFRHAVQAIKRARAELDRLDYKCMKYNEGALPEGEYQEVVTRKAELRAIVNEQRPTFRSTLNEIKEANSQFRLPSRSALFKACCDYDNAALDQFREWLAPKQNVPAAEVTE